MHAPSQLRPRSARFAIARHTIALFACLAAVACGNKGGSANDKPAAGAAAPALERAGLGSDSPKVDVIAFIGYQCPHCKASAADLLAVMEANKETTRLRLINLPLEAHPDSVALARAAIAARKLGQWQAWWKLVFESEKVDESLIKQFSAQPGVDAAKFDALRQGQEVTDELAFDVGLAEALGVKGTPSYLVNGALLQGVQPKATWEAIVKAQAGEAAALLQGGTKPADLLKALVEKNSPKRAPFYVKHVLQGEKPPAAPVPAKVERPSGIIGAQIAPAGAASTPIGQTLRFGDPPADPKTIWRVLVRADDPPRGPATAPVTVVVFGDYECPHTAALQPTLAALQTDLPSDVRLIWKHNPLSMHPGALPAAKAADAARAQGKFWEMHDAGFAAGAPLSTEKIEAAAQKAGLDLAAFRLALAGSGATDRLAGDQEQVDALVMRGTPNLYVNGHHLIGAVDAATLRTVVDEGLARAKAELQTGTPAAQLYEKLVGGGKLLDSLGTLPAIINTSAGLSRGLPGAAVHIVTFQDLQCPFCARLDQHLRVIEAEMQGKVMLTWMDYPRVDVHPHALLAAQAGREANAQGKFWPFHAIAMNAQDKLDRDGLLELGRQAGLDVKALAKSLDSGKWLADVEKSKAVGDALALKGTPTVYINGLPFTPQLGFSASTFRVAVQRVLRSRE